jgi:GT2 family glycosyltransferase
LSDPLVTVVIPTLAADSRLLECLAALEKQTWRNFEVIVVDNSGRGLAKQRQAGRFGASVIEAGQNIGFGAAINRGFHRSRAPFIATLNDDAVAQREWLRALAEAIEPRDDIGMCASKVRIFGESRLDSAGMLVSGDGSSKQRGHGASSLEYDREEEVLFPSASAALYRRAMLDGIGLFDEDFFLYCEDTDLGLRARWAGWKCLYVPHAVVEHHYSHSAGGASPLKAYYVERNRLFVLVKNYPAGMLPGALVVSLTRYWWHLWFLLRGRGSAARFREEGNAGIRLAWFVLRAHCATLWRWRRLWPKRRAIQRLARITPAAWVSLLRAHFISARQLAEL